MIKDTLITSQNRLAVLIDDSHTIHPSTLLAIKRRWDALSFSMRRLVSFILLGQPRLWQTLEMESLVEVKTHADRYEIMGLLNEMEVDNYISAKFKPFTAQAKCGVERWFAPEVGSRIFDYVRVNKIQRDRNLRYQLPQIFPRELNEILIGLLETAYRAEDNQVTADHVAYYFSKNFGARI
jgi:type II secretory pathway predicted ATPase ExeA